jgi:hypothetical protein
MALKLVHSERQGEYLLLTLQGDNIEEVSNAAARQFAYAARHELGFSNAGLEGSGGPYPIDLTKDNPETPNHMGLPVPMQGMIEISKRVQDIGYRQLYRLTRSLA